MQPIPAPTLLTLESVAEATEWLQHSGVAFHISRWGIWITGASDFLSLPCELCIWLFGDFVVLGWGGRIIATYKGEGAFVLKGTRLKSFFHNIIFTDSRCVIFEEKVVYRISYEGIYSMTHTRCGLEIAGLQAGALRPCIRGSVPIYGHNVARLVALIRLMRRGKLPLPRELLIEIVLHLDPGDVRI